MDPGPTLDARRARVAAAGLTGDAVAALAHVVRALPIEALTPVKTLLKHYFSNAPWTDADDDALAEIVGPGTGEDHHDLGPDLVLVWGWTDGPFRLRLLDAGEHRPGG